ncbi:acyl-CoA thioesterase [Sphingomicrobium lutaoense]|uniref:Acyl-CoA thioesterase n=1 Tax=Sphingomicrobium lutaoense TaxID=515949 RepID=A0A839YY50_9SPHN|nr:thioesterase family protein [Sphingomicrobium lutaoense]MBB3763410.1 acyl-CoA thioesterase [Sphingomicrobium lutaoense]
MTFGAALKALERDKNGFSIHAPADWAQGRTLYGGMTAALAHECAIRSLDGLPPLRSAQMLFVGPAEGRLSFTATLLRQGRSATLVAVDAHGEKGQVLRASLVFGAARESMVTFSDLAIPDAPPPDQCQGLFGDAAARAPGFTGNFIMLNADGGRPFMGDEAPLRLWTRFRDAPGANPTSALLAMADVPPPAAMTRFRQFAPISSMTWQIDILHHPESMDGWHLMRSRAEGAGEGYSPQEMQLWDESGRCLAAGRQSIAIFT